MKRYVILLAASLALAGCTLRGAPQVTLTPFDPGQVTQQPVIPTSDPIAESATQTALAVPLETPTPDPNLVTPSPTVDPNLPTPTPTPDPNATPTVTPPAEAGVTPTAAGSAECPETHTVAQGENLYRIALRYNRSVADVASLNGITNPNNISVGQVLRIPGCGSNPPGSGGGSGAPGAGSGGSYVVQQGDNLFRIALRFGTTYQQLAALNGIPNPAVITPGQVLRIP